MGIDFDPMAAHLGRHLLAIPVKNNEGGPLLRHMAVDAIASSVMIFREHRTLGFVTAQTTGGKDCNIVLTDMHVVTGKAGHGR